MNHPDIERAMRTGYCKPQPPAWTGQVKVSSVFVVDISDDDTVFDADQAATAAKDKLRDSLAGCELDFDDLDVIEVDSNAQ